MYTSNSIIIIFALHPTANSNALVDFSYSHFLTHRSHHTTNEQDAIHYAANY